MFHSLYDFARPHSLELLKYYDIPVYGSLDIACRCITVLCDYGHKLAEPHRKASFVFNRGRNAKDEGQTIIENALREGRHALLEHEGKALLALHDAPVSTDRLAKDAEEAVRIAEGMNGEVALKIVSPDILHKSDACGVSLFLKEPDEIRTAFNQIIKNAKEYNGEATIPNCAGRSRAEVAAAAPPVRAAAFPVAGVEKTNVTRNPSNGV